MSNALQVTGENFDAEVAKADKPVLVDFFAEWCGPCKMMAPVLDELAGEMVDAVKVAKVDCDSDADLAGRFGISSIPCLILFKNGEEVDRRVGASAKEDLKSWLESKS